MDGKHKGRQQSVWVASQGPHLVPNCAEYHEDEDALTEAFAGEEAEAAVKAKDEWVQSSNTGKAWSGLGGVSVLLQLLAEDGRQLSLEKVASLTKEREAMEALLYVADSMVVAIHGAWPSPVLPLAAQVTCTGPALVVVERKKERSTPVARRVLRGHELGSGHRTFLCLVIQGSLIL